MNTEFNIYVNADICTYTTRFALHSSHKLAQIYFQSDLAEVTVPQEHSQKSWHKETVS